MERSLQSRRRRDYLAEMSEIDNQELEMDIDKLWRLNDLVLKEVPESSSYDSDPITLVYKKTCSSRTSAWDKTPYISLTESQGSSATFPPEYLLKTASQRVNLDDPLQHKRSQSWTPFQDLKQMLKRSSAPRISYAEEFQDCHDEE